MYIIRLLFLQRVKICKAVESDYINAYMVFVIVACDNGWLPYNNHCYWLSPSPSSFYNAVVSIQCVNTCVIVDMQLRQQLVIKLGSNCRLHDCVVPK